MGGPMKLILVTLFLIASGAHAEESSWEKLHDRLLESQNYYSEYNMFLLENITPNKFLDHQADYIKTANVIVNSDNTLTPVGVRTISETWKLTAESTWDIDQWKHTADDGGTLVSVEHYHIVETQDNIVLAYEILPVKPASDPEEIANWQSVLERWYTWNL